MKDVVDCVMRNNQGQWVKRAAGMIGLTLPLATEIWSIYYELKLAWERGDVSNVVIECDDEEAMNHVNKPDPDFWLLDLSEIDGDGGITELEDAPDSMSSILAADET
ncbi:hypothetical protein ACET3Z_031344 [Daucus carota]